MEEDRRRYTLKDVWNAITTEKNFNYSFWLEITMQILFTHCMSTFGRFLVLVVCFLVLTLWYVGFFIVLPEVAAIGSLAFFVHIACGLFVVFNIYFNYFLVVTTSPGSPSKIADDLVEEGECFDYKTCKKCNRAKPPRTHHCSICKKCILRMDHHCPYVANCVGRNNYRYFYCFILWTFIGTLYLSLAGAVVFFTQEDSTLVFGGGNFQDVSSGPIKLANMSELQKLAPLNSRNRVVGGLRRRQPYSESVNRRLNNATINYSRTIVWPSNGLNYDNSQINRRLLSFYPLQRFMSATTTSEAVNILLQADLQILLATIISASLTLAVGCLFVFHTFLIRSGLTTIEYYESWSIRIKLNKDGRIYKNQYDRGLSKNVESVLGKDPWYIAILPSMRSPLDESDFHTAPPSADSLI